MTGISDPIEYTNKVGDVGLVWYDCLTDHSRPAGYYRCEVIAVYSYHSPHFGFYPQCCDVRLDDGKISYGHFMVERL